MIAISRLANAAPDLAVCLNMSHASMRDKSESPALFGAGKTWASAVAFPPEISLVGWRRTVRKELLSREAD
jgi:hypothetical protein